ncbi:eukaryotic translation initiation factor 4E [Basidiobolus meristosporus CBS 931.73]|uniref:Eukaryotic translation initiation factor 4E n=1 Tax=Basidiobolus meristosporus CBS 931.73 TaxID=1314790 RepID=A0A1Y1Z8K9_9FUNG|nr:eukaryotic translation initiation factor 4E [Basidiobolus meristosporus CBS 931.73]|eukprot:ORY06598.1 eukaryotic translation initiation factor 4E [Basidiobolus meristosporus CBS 931.73]
MSSVALEIAEKPVTVSQPDMENASKEVEDLSDSLQKQSAAQEEQEMVTVFTDPVNFNVKHPLNNAWTLWYDNPGKKTNHSSWSQNLKEVVTFSTVEDFWGTYNNVVRVSDLTSGSNYHLFKEGIRPMWEDAANEQGGKWVIQFPKKTGEEINNLWLYTILCCIGETFSYENEVTGAVASARKSFYRLSLWTRTSDSREICEAIGLHLKESLGMSPNQHLEFQSHADAAKGASLNKGRYVV